LHNDVVSQLNAEMKKSDIDSPTFEALIRKVDHVSARVDKAAAASLGD
jgi:hypothetical protein